MATENDRLSKDVSLKEYFIKNAIEKLNRLEQDVILIICKFLFCIAYP